MNALHRALLEQLRSCEAVRTKIEGMSDDELLRQLMSNLRGIGDRAVGMRLSYWGSTILRECFRAYEIERDPTPIGALALVYLDRAARLPYYISTKHELVMFDPDLAIKLKLCGGEFGTLIEIDGGLRRRPNR